MRFYKKQIVGNDTMVLVVSTNGDSYATASARAPKLWVYKGSPWLMDYEGLMGYKEIKREEAETILGHEISEPHYSEPEADPFRGF